MGTHRCICNPGYEVDNTGKLCLDINECTDDLVCSGGQCKNTPGSYQVSLNYIIQQKNHIQILILLKNITQLYFI